MKVTRLNSGGFLTSGSDAGDLAILRKAKNIDDGSGMKAGGRVKRKVRSMRQVTIPSPDLEKAYLIELKQAAKAVRPVSGLLVKRK